MRHLPWILGSMSLLAGAGSLSSTIQHQPSEAQIVVVNGEAVTITNDPEVAWKASSRSAVEAPPQLAVPGGKVSFVGKGWKHELFSYALQREISDLLVTSSWQEAAAIVEAQFAYGCDRKSTNYYMLRGFRVYFRGHDQWFFREFIAPRPESVEFLSQACTATWSSERAEQCRQQLLAQAGQPLQGFLQFLREYASRQ